MVLALAAASFAAACTDVTSDTKAVLSIKFDTLAAPGVIVNDSLRDTTGAIALPIVTAYNFSGNVVPGAIARFHAADRGVTVDSVTGLIRGDSLRSTPVRIIATVGEIQAQQFLTVTLRPDTICGANKTDSIRYSLLDSTLNLSPAVTVNLRHGVAGADSAVYSYLVSFSILSPATPGLADLVDDGGRKSRLDTTDVSGVAGRRIRLHATALTGPTQTDSIVISAIAKYRGAVVKGGPVRLVVYIKPRN